MRLLVVIGENVMTKDEFINKAKELGYSDETISEVVKIHDEAEKDGINIPWESDLIELPVFTFNMIKALAENAGALEIYSGTNSLNPNFEALQGKYEGGFGLDI